MDEDETLGVLVMFLVGLINDWADEELDDRLKEPLLGRRKLLLLLEREEAETGEGEEEAAAAAAAAAAATAFTSPRPNKVL